MRQTVLRSLGGSVKVFDALVVAYKVNLINGLG